MEGRHKLFRILCGEAAQLLQCFRETSFVERSTLDLLRFKLSLTQPCGGGRTIRGERGRLAENGIGAFPKRTPFVNSGNAEEAQENPKLSHGFVRLHNPTGADQFPNGHCLEPAELLLQLVGFAMTGKRITVNALMVRPERSRDTEYLLQLQGGIGRNRGLSGDDFVDGLQRAAHAFGKFRLRHAEGFERFGQRLARRHGEVGFKCRVHAF